LSARLTISLRLPADYRRAVRPGRGGLVTRAAPRYCAAMTMPSDRQIADLGAALDNFARRYKLTDVMPGRPLAEIDKQILLYVDRHPGCGPTDVARFLGVATTTISSATDRMAKRGLLSRDRLADDRRAVALKLTDAGQAYVAAHQQAYLEMFRSMLERLSPEERDSLVAMMQKIASDDG
jgi:DNA-binding MarR family transcriptional regulator